MNNSHALFKKMNIARKKNVGIIEKLMLWSKLMVSIHEYNEVLAA